MKIIPLSRGKSAIIDDADFDTISKHKWRYTSHGYASTNIGGRYVYMHRLIMRASESEEVDHKNHDGLDNTRSNLRICNSSQNKCNRKVRRDNKSGFKGVGRHQGKYRTRIKLQGQSFQFWPFNTPEEAHQKYVEESKRLHGEFSHS